MEKGTKLRRRIGKALAKTLCFCLAAASVAGAAPQARRAEAAPAATNYISPERPEGDIVNHGLQLTHYEFSADGRLTLSNRYHYVAGDLLTYSTVDYIWSKVDMDAPGRKPGYPMDAANGVQGKDWVRLGVGAEGGTSDAATGYTDTYYRFSQDKIKSSLTALFGELKADTEYTVYMSEIFILRYRYVNKPDVYYRDREYTNLDDIRGAAAEWFRKRGQTGTWTQSTYDNFVAYYNIPMTFVLHSGNLEIVCIDEQTGTVIKQTGEKRLADGKTFAVYPEGRITVETAEGTRDYTYTNHYGVSDSFDQLLDQKGGAAEIKGGIPAGRTKYVFFGYKAQPVPAEVRIVCVDADDMSKVLASSSQNARLNEPCYIGVTRRIQSGVKYYEYADKFGIRNGFGGAPELPFGGAPGNIMVTSSEMTVYLGYRATTEPPDEEPPSPTVMITPSINEGERFDRYDRYYTTSEGYTLGKVQKDGSYGSELYKAAVGNMVNIPSYVALSQKSELKREGFYKTGVDSRGNWWGFIAATNGTDALEVHPISYGGNYVESEAIKNITELVFPAQISSGGKNYTVRSIGGCGEKYNSNHSLFDSQCWPNPYPAAGMPASVGSWNTSNSFGRISGSYSFSRNETQSVYKTVSGPYGSYQTTSRYFYTFGCDSGSYWYGVAGTGEIYTSGRLQMSDHMYDYPYTMKDSLDERDYNYHVYNTTLRRVVIPDTVTEILPYAFCFCQALKSVEGGAGIQKIGDKAFMGVPTTAAARDKNNEFHTDSYQYREGYAYWNTQKSYSVTDSYGYPHLTEFFYNESKKTADADTETMKEWKRQIPLSESLSFPAPEQWQSLASIGKRAFAFHDNLRGVVLGESVGEVGIEAFGYDRLVEITVCNRNAVIGDASGDTYSGDRNYQTLGTHGYYVSGESDPRTRVIAAADSTAKEYVDRYNCWYRMGDGRKTVDLNGWKPDIHTDTVIEVTDGEKPRPVTIPVKYDFVFKGYFTEPEGKGKQYYDENGEPVRKWEDPDVDELFAWWEAAPPEDIPPVEPEDDPVAEGEMRFTIRRDDSRVQIYADDYDSATGAYDDMQPYLVTDVAREGAPAAEGGIPSTERVALRAKAGAYFYDVALKKKTGKVSTNVTVTVPYHFTYQDAEGNRTESSGSRSYTFAVEKYYGYWEVEGVTVYLADKVAVNNAAFNSGSLTIPVDWTAAEAPPVPNPAVSKTGSVKPAPDKTAVYPYTYSGTFTSASDYAAAAAGIDSAMRNAASSMVLGVESPTVTNDRLVIEGVVVLDNSPAIKEGPAPDARAVEGIKNLIPDTDYTQAYLSGAVLRTEAENGVYASLAQVTYREKNGTRTKALSPECTAVNGIKVHTPVVCDGIIAVSGTETGRYADGDFKCGVTADFPLRGIYNPFTVQVSNYGLHKVILGYGEKDFAKAKSGEKNIVSNAVKFDFDVYYDTGKDTFKSDGSVDFTGDVLFPANTWITVAEGEPRFYVLGSVTPGEYHVQFRSVAANCPKDAAGNFIYEGKDQKNANKNIGKYVATDTIVLNIHEDFMGFELNGTNDPQAKKAFDAGRRMLTLDRGYYFNFKTLTIGERFNTPGMKVEITPTYTFVSSDGKIRVDTDLYYSESIKGKSEYFVKVGNVKDLSNAHTYTNRDELPGIPDTLLQNTVKVTGNASLAGRKAELFTFGGKIVSDQYFRMHPVISEKLPDRWCRECYAVYSSLDARPCRHASAAVTLLGADAQKKLVQEWYGGFYIPADTYAVPKDTKEGFCSACGKTRYMREGRTTCPEHGTALTGLKAFSFAAYAAQNTLTGGEEFFEQDGYIAISFEIKAVDGAYVRRFGQYDETEIAKQWKESSIPYRTGDVILYRLDKSIRDAYEIGGSE